MRGPGLTCRKARLWPAPHGMKRFLPLGACLVFPDPAGRPYPRTCQFAALRRHVRGGRRRIVHDPGTHHSLQGPGKRLDDGPGRQADLLCDGRRRRRRRRTRYRRHQSRETTAEWPPSSTTKASPPTRPPERTRCRPPHPRTPCRRHQSREMTRPGHCCQRRCSTRAPLSPRSGRRRHH